MRITRKLAAAVAVAALPLAAASAASAGTSTHHPMFLFHGAPFAPFANGKPLYETGSSGYAVTSAQFRSIAETAYLRNPGQYASITGGYGFGVTLETDSLQINIGVSAATLPASTLYSPGLTEYDNGALVSGSPYYSAQWCPAGGSCQAMASGDGFAVGDSVTESLSYNRSSGKLNYLASDAAGNEFTGAFDVGTRLSFHEANVGAGYNTSAYAAPKTATKLVAISGVAVTTYTGKTTGLSSWFTCSEEIATSNGLKSGTKQMEPTALSGSGTSFTMNFVPAG